MPIGFDTVITRQTCKLCGEDNGEQGLSWVVDKPGGKVWRHFCRRCLSQMAEAYYTWTYEVGDGG